MNERSLSSGLLAWTALAQLLVVVDAGPLTALVVAGYLLVAPGAALSLRMGPMGAEARCLVALLGSFAVGAVVTGGLILTGLWSPRVAFALLAIVTVGAVLLVPSPDATATARAATDRGAGGVPD